MAFLEDLKGFYGTGEKNRAGQSLEEFLSQLYHGYCGGTV